MFELLVDGSPDRGKETKVSLDWTDADLLREFLKRRLVYNNIPSAATFDDSWSMICTSHINGEKTSDFLIQLSLMRPRNLLNLVNYCKSNAVNLQHEKISDSDIEKAFSTYSHDIVNEIGLEIRDIFPQAEDILYNFIGASNYLSLEKLREYLAETSIPSKSYSRVIEILIWFAFLGVADISRDEPQETYIFDVFYDIKKLKKIAKDFKNKNTVFSIHKAFWPYLGIDAIDHRNSLLAALKNTKAKKGNAKYKGDTSQLDLKFS